MSGEKDWYLKSLEHRDDIEADTREYEGGNKQFEDVLQEQLDEEVKKAYGKLDGPDPPYPILKTEPGLLYNPKLHLLKEGIIFVLIMLDDEELLKELWGLGYLKYKPEWKYDNFKGYRIRRQGSDEYIYEIPTNSLIDAESSISPLDSANLKKLPETKLYPKYVEYLYEGGPEPWDYGGPMKHIVENGKKKRFKNLYQPEYCCRTGGYKYTTGEANINIEKAPICTGSYFDGFSEVYCNGKYFYFIVDKIEQRLLMLEFRIVQLISEDKTQDQIGKSLGFSARTALRTIKCIRSKLLTLIMRENLVLLCQNGHSISNDEIEGARHWYNRQYHYWYVKNVKGVTPKGVLTNT